MGVTIKAKHTVVPAEHTPVAPMYLSEIDQILGFIAPTTHFYLNPPQNAIHKLKHSLSLALVHFYPLAGRLERLHDGSLRLQCNASGAHFIEAYSDSEISSFGNFSPRQAFDSLIPVPNLDLPIEQIPLLNVQITTFQCGGIGIGLMMSHVAADGTSGFHFVHEWARLARDEPLRTPPYLNRMALLPNGAEPLPREHHAELQPPPLLIGDSTVEDLMKKPATVAMLELTESQVEKLRRIANVGRDSCAREYSRYESITAHVWRSTCKARGHNQKQPTALCVAVNFRKRLQPNLPEGYFGNAGIAVTARGESGDVIKKPLGYAAGLVRGEIGKVTSEYVWSSIEWSKRKRESREGMPYFGNPNLAVISWLTLPIYGWDFGWGNEVGIGLGTKAGDGNMLMFPGRDGNGSVSVAVCLSVEHIESFKRLFYEGIEEDV